MSPLSPEAQAILLLTAPLAVGREAPCRDLLSRGEFGRLARRLQDMGAHAGDLLSPGADSLLAAAAPEVPTERLRRLLDRGFLLSQALDHWRTRAIWVLTLADGDYPGRLAQRLGADAPPVLYGCGDVALLSAGGLAVVGSRDVDQTLLDYAGAVGRLAAEARRTVVSGAARGVDQAAMHGSLAASGRALGVLADSLEQAAVSRANRDAIMAGALALASPFDPRARFHVGQAMQRNKLIYALSDAALVVNADVERGGTWAGAVEQLQRYGCVPVYVRSQGAPSRALLALRAKGALPWPEPAAAEGLVAALGCATAAPTTADPGAADAAVLALLRQPRSDREIATALGLSLTQTKQRLQALLTQGRLERLSRPVRYALRCQPSLFDDLETEVVSSPRPLATV
jgi:predicted Rossmann fold nucleotide-binding protein DprA/Smf involved in DNA uptake